MQVGVDLHGKGFSGSMHGLPGTKNQFKLSIWCCHGLVDDWETARKHVHCLVYLKGTQDLLMNPINFIIFWSKGFRPFTPRIISGNFWEFTICQQHGGRQRLKVII